MATLKLLGGRRAALAIPAALAVMAGTAFVATATPDATSDASPEVSAAIEFADNLSAAFRNAASSISPAVVNIAVVNTPDASPLAERGRGGMRSPGQVPDEFRRFFRFGPEGATPDAPRPAPERRGQGSGVIIRSDGYILTNNHVVDDADEVTVRLQDGRELEATVVGLDPDSDLAVIRVDASGLPTARFGDSDRVRTGDWIVAVGNPFGLDHTVTAGVVSATGRGEMGLSTYEDFIQTDAAINPGNSGGPLVNLHGEVIGINSAIRSASGGNNGVGFAIPAKLARHVADSLIESGRVERGWLGVSVQPLTQDLARTMGYAEARGALVADVMPETPAAAAGLASGDVIVRVGDEPVDSARELINAIAQHEPGRRVSLGIDRNGESRSIDVTLGERPGAAQIASTPQDSASAEGKLGMSVQALTPELAAQLGIEAARGVVVTEVKSDSPAQKAGIRAEDVILEAGREPIGSPADLARAAKEAGDSGVLLRVSRDGRVRFVVVKPGS